MLLIPQGFYLCSGDKWDWKAPDNLTWAQQTWINFSQRFSLTGCHTTFKKSFATKKGVQDCWTNMTFKRKGEKPTYSDLKAKAVCFGIMVKISACICISRRTLCSELSLKIMHLPKWVYHVLPLHWRFASCETAVPGLQCSVVYIVTQCAMVKKANLD